MKARDFNSYAMPYVNNLWVANVLNMQLNPKKGPDIIDKDKVVEVKFNLIYQSKPNYISWRVLEHQLAYNNGKQAFWALGTYQLNRPVKKIKTKNPILLEAMVTERELYLIDWNWMLQFQCYIQRGKTETSEWCNHLRFPKFSMLPKTIATYQVPKGLVHITEGVPIEKFQIADNNIPF